MEKGAKKVAAAALTSPLSASSSFLRFLGLLEQPEPDPNPFQNHQRLELDESYVLWSSTDGVLSYTRSPLNKLSSKRSSSLRRTFVPERCGLSAILAEDRLPLVRQSRLAPRFAQPVLVPSPGRAEEEEEEAVTRGFHHLQSAPVNVPLWPKLRTGQKADILEEIEDLVLGKEDEGEEEMVPPHVIVARSQATTTFSVFEGVGRTLKGRDLRRVRNAVWQKTGFLD